MPANLSALNPQADHDCTRRAQDYLFLAHESATEALKAMESLRAQRRAEGGLAPQGRTSDQDQDLLRAMLVFSCAGVDAAMKTLVEDALPVLATRLSGVQEKLTKFAESHLSDAGAVSPRALARILSQDRAPRDAVVAEFIEQLTGGSLQSANQLDVVCGALGIENAELRRRVDKLHPVFEARNEIIHELDLDPSPRRRRRHRSISTMVEWASEALAVSQDIVNAVAKSLSIDQ